MAIPSYDRKGLRTIVTRCIVPAVRRHCKVRKTVAGWSVRQLQFVCGMAFVVSAVCLVDLGMYRNQTAHKSQCSKPVGFTLLCGPTCFDMSVLLCPVGCRKKIQNINPKRPTRANVQNLLFSLYYVGRHGRNWQKQFFAQNWHKEANPCVQIKIAKLAD